MYRKNPDKFREKVRLWAKANPMKVKETQDRCHKREVFTINDKYVREKLRQGGMIASDENIKLKRTAITIKRIEREMINELAG
jgi:hypothetical protein